MKRTTFTFVVLFTLGFATIGAAQTKRYSVQQVNELLKAQGIDAVVVTPEAPQQPATVAPTNRTPSAPAAVQQPTGMEEFLARFPQAVEANGTIGSFEQNLAMRQELFANQGFGYQYGYGAYNQVLALKIDGASKTGWLKINANGDTDFVRYLHVLRKEGNNWVYVGGGGKSFRIFHEGMELPIGHHTLRFELRRGGRTQFLTEEFEIMSKYDREKPLQYTVDSESFASFANVEEIKRPQ